MIVLTVVLAAMAAVLLLPTFSDVLSTWRAWTGNSAPERAVGDDELPTVLLLIPAHDEELLIGDCLLSLQQLRYQKDRLRIIVVADNCTDGTAEIVRTAGVTCLERFDLEQRGKPYALSWAVARLPLDQVDAVVIVDGDTRLHPDFVAAVAKHTPLRNKVIQAFNDVGNAEENALTRMARVLSAVNHRYAFGLKQRVGLNLPLSAGMCIGADVLKRYGWPAFSICEDWELYAYLSVRGVPIEGAPTAQLLAQEARSLHQSASQRRRWMAGKITVLAEYTSRILRSTSMSTAQKLDCLAELSAPGPAVHLGLVVMGCSLTLVLQPPGSRWLAAVMILSLARLITYTVRAILADPEPLKAAWAFVYLPVYTVWRMGTSISALRLLGSATWIRTSRHRSRA
jgi:cellulose synthase/poly-beta-1,6-N-acetylglucosamine synthase-like glycosyltransferase